MNGNEDEFYVGYDETTPPGMRRMVLAAVVTSAVAALVVAALFVRSERPLANSRFEYGTTHEIAGYLRRWPVPTLTVRDEGGWRNVWLVSQGKFGAERTVGSLPDGWVRLRGSVIEREPWEMLEVVAGSVRPQREVTDTPPVAPAPGRHVAARGEVVDSKCYLGVMNPGERTVHRDCAVRCLAGGVPPMFAFREDGGEMQLALVVDGGAVATADRLRGLVGRPVELTGTLIGEADRLVFVLDR